MNLHCLEQVTPLSDYIIHHINPWSMVPLPVDGASWVRVCASLRKIKRYDRCDVFLDIPVALLKVEKEILGLTAG